MRTLNISTKPLQFAGVQQLAVNARDLHRTLLSDSAFEPWWAFAYNQNGLSLEADVVHQDVNTPWVTMSAAREIMGSYCVTDEPEKTDWLREQLRTKEREWLSSVSVK